MTHSAGPQEERAATQRRRGPNSGPHGCWSGAQGPSSQQQAWLCPHHRPLMGGEKKAPLAGHSHFIRLVHGTPARHRSELVNSLPRVTGASVSAPCSPASNTPAFPAQVSCRDAQDARKAGASTHPQALTHTHTLYTPHTHHYTYTHYTYHAPLHTSKTHLHIPVTHNTASQCTTNISTHTLPRSHTHSLGWPDQSICQKGLKLHFSTPALYVWCFCVGGGWEGFGLVSAFDPKF